MRFLSHVNMTYASMNESATENAQDLVTSLIKPAPVSPFAPLNESNLQSIFHLADIFKQATDPDPIVTTISIPIPDVTPPKVPHYAPPRVNVFLLPTMRPRVSLLRVPGSHLESTKISPLKIYFSTLTPGHKNP